MARPRRKIMYWLSATNANWTDYGGGGRWYPCDYSPQIDWPNTNRVRWCNVRHAYTATRAHNLALAVVDEFGGACTVERIHIHDGKCYGGFVWTYGEE